MWQVLTLNWKRNLIFCLTCYVIMFTCSKLMPQEIKVPSKDAVSATKVTVVDSNQYDSKFIIKGRVDSLLVYSVDFDSKYIVKIINDSTRLVTVHNWPKWKKVLIHVDGKRIGWLRRKSLPVTNLEVLFKK